MRAPSLIVKTMVVSTISRVLRSYFRIANSCRDIPGAYIMYPSLRLRKYQYRTTEMYTSEIADRMTPAVKMVMYFAAMPGKLPA